MTYFAPETEQMEVRMEANFLASVECLGHVNGGSWEEDD